MPVPTLVSAERVGNRLRINWDVVSLEWFRYGLQVELEHKPPSLLAAGRIVIDHLLEFPDYYQRLKRMEAQAVKFWQGKTKPKVIR